MRALERYLLLQIIDQRWREHLYDMDYLREGIHLRGFAQIDPLVAYKNEAFTLFSDLMNTIWSDFSRMIFHVEVQVEGENGDAPVQQYTPSGSSTRSGRVSYSGGSGYGPAQRAGGGRRAPPRRPRPCPSPSSSAAWPRSSRSGATTPAGAGRARSSRNATAHSATTRTSHIHGAAAHSAASRQRMTSDPHGRRPRG